ncbi:hypothetical protein D3C87_1702460 [compost metagenome]
MAPFGNFTATVMPSPTENGRVEAKNTSLPSLKMRASLPLAPSGPVKTAVSVAFTPCGKVMVAEISPIGNCQPLPVTFQVSSS